MQVPFALEGRAVISFALLSGLGLWYLLAEHWGNVGPVTLPPVSPSATGLIAISSILVLPRSTRVVRIGALVVPALTLIVSGLALSTWRQMLLAPLPVAAKVYPLAVTSARTGGTTVFPALSILNRRHLKRLTGMATDVGLDSKTPLLVPRSGKYLFEVLCDDRCTLWLDSRRLANVIGQQRVEIHLDTGLHNLRVRYEQRSGPAALSLDWTGPGGPLLLPLEHYLVSRTAENGFVSVRRKEWLVLASGALAWLWWMAFVAIGLNAAQSMRYWLGSTSRPDSQTAVSRKQGLASPVTWWIVAGGSALFARLLSWLRPSFVESARRVYEVDAWRLGFALERIRRYPDFLSALTILAVGLGLWFFVLARRPEIAGRLSLHRLHLLAAAGTLAALAWGFVVSSREWVRYGRPCWDGYCRFGELVAEALQNPTAGWQDLFFFLETYIHANSPLGPALFGGLSLLLPDVVTAYRLTAALATIGTLVIVIRIAREHLRLSVTATLAATFLYAASGHVQRSLFFPQTDALATFFFALTVDRALVFRASDRPRDFVFLVASVTLGLFTKLSALPLPLIAGLTILWPSDSDESVSTPGRSDRFVHVVLVGLIPLALVAGYAVMLQTFDNYLVELAARGTEDSRLTRHAIAAATGLLPLLMALIVSRNQRWSSTERILFACVGIYLLSLWAGGGSGWDRFYLNLQPVALPLAVKRFTRCQELREPAVAFPLALAYLLAHAFRMELGLYY